MTSKDLVAPREHGEEPLRHTLRVIHVAAPAAFGGLERVVHALSTGQRDRGHDVGVAALLGRGVPEPALLGDLRAAGVRVHSLTFEARAYVAQIRGLARLFAERAPDIVHSHGYQSDILVALLKRKDTPSLVTTVHGFTGGDRKARLYEWLQIRAYRRFDAVVTVSSEIKEQLERSGVPSRRLHVVRNALMPQTSVTHDHAPNGPAIPSGVFSIGWVGRVSREKGLDVLIEALPLLSDLALRLTVVGDGPDVAMLKERSRTLRVAERITWLGVVPNAARMLSAFDAVVLSSRTEGTPITLLEAMQAEVPVVATSVGGVPDVISEREAALVPPERPDLLARAIRQTLLDRAAAAERVGRARARLDSAFSGPAWSEAYEGIYRSVRSAANQIRS